MKRIFGLLPLSLLVVTFILYGCKGKADGTTDNTSTSENVPIFKVSGNINYQGNPIQGVDVSIDDKINYSAQTDEAGYFEIQNVPQGDHKLLVKKSFEDGTSVEHSKDISVYADVLLSSLKLPKAALLNEPVNITDNSISLSWVPTDADDFREYKLYRHNNSGLDETIGELIHVSTSRDDTTFVDQGLAHLQIYYYRVYVMNDFGRLGGSNIVSATTKETLIVKNGDFEETGTTSGSPKYWDGADGTILYRDTTQGYSGTSSLLVDIPKDTQSMVGLVQEIALDVNARYKLSWYVKHEGLNSGAFTVYILYGTWQYLTSSYPKLDSASTGWTLYEKEFLVTPDMVQPYHIQIQSHVKSSTDAPAKIWVDKVELHKVLQ